MKRILLDYFPFVKYLFQFQIGVIKREDRNLEECGTKRKVAIPNWCHKKLYYGLPDRIQTCDTEGRNLMLCSLSYGESDDHPGRIQTITDLPDLVLLQESDDHPGRIQTYYILFI